VRKQQNGADSKSKLLLDQPDQTVFDLGMARNRCSPACHGVGVDIVTLTVTLQVAATSYKRADEVRSFHVCLA